MFTIFSERDIKSAYDKVAYIIILADVTAECFGADIS